MNRIEIALTGLSGVPANPVVLRNGAPCGAQCVVESSTSSSVLFTAPGAGTYSIQGVTGGVCGADFNNDGTLDHQDIFAFLNAWFANTINADFNNDGVVTVQDIFAFLSAWHAGC